MRSPKPHLPNRHDLANSAVSVAVGAATGWLLATAPKHRSKPGPTEALPDDPAWHAALHSQHPPRSN